MAASDVAGTVRGRSRPVSASPPSPISDGDARSRGQPGRRVAGRPDGGGDDRPGQPGAERRPERIGQRQGARGRALRLAARLAQDDERERRIGEAHPEPGDAERRDRDQPGHVRPSTSSIPASPTVVDREPDPDEALGRPARRAAGLDPGAGRPGDGRRGQRDARPRSPTAPRHSTRVSATNASTAKKAQVRTPRSRTAAGSTGRATSVPGGVRRRSAKMPMTQPDGAQDDGRDRLAARQPDGQQPGPEGDGQGQRQPAAVGRRRRAASAGRRQRRSRAARRASARRPAR